MTDFPVRTEVFGDIIITLSRPSSELSASPATPATSASSSATSQSPALTHTSTSASTSEQAPL